MNILMLLILPMAAHGDQPCPQFVTNNADIQMVAANGYGLSREGHAPTGEASHRAAPSRKADVARGAARYGSDDLLFYLSSHAQAVGDASGQTMTPWLELRPIGAVQQDALAGESSSAPISDAHACERSAAHAPVPGHAWRSGDV